MSNTIAPRSARPPPASFTTIPDGTLRTARVLSAWAGPRLVTVSFTETAAFAVAVAGAVTVVLRSARAGVTAVTVSVNTAGVAEPDVAVTVKGPGTAPATSRGDVAVPSAPDVAVPVSAPPANVAPPLIVKVTGAPATGLAAPSWTRTTRGRGNVEPAFADWPSPETVVTA